MVRKRNHFKQTASLEEPLTKFSKTLRDQVRTLPAGSKQAKLSQKIQDAALRINAWLNSEKQAPEARPARVKPGMPWVEKRHLILPAIGAVKV